MTDPMNEPMTSAQFEQQFNFAIHLLSAADLKGYFKSHTHHSQEILQLATHIKYNPAILRDAYMAGDYEIIERLLSINHLPDDLYVHGEHIKNYIFSTQMLKIYNDANINTNESTKHYLETGENKQKQITIAYRRHYHEQTKRCKGSVTRSLTFIKNSDSLWKVLIDCCRKEDEWLRRRHIAQFRASVVNWYKKPKSERRDPITNCELVTFNARLWKNIVRFS